MSRSSKCTFQQQRATENGQVSAVRFRGHNFTRGHICASFVKSTSVYILPSRVHHNQETLSCQRIFSMGAGLQRVLSRSLMMTSFRFENCPRLKIAHCDEMALEHLRFKQVRVSQIFY
jgi:hypothetical protein